MAALLFFEFRHIRNPVQICRNIPNRDGEIKKIERDGM